MDAPDLPAFPGLKKAGSFIDLDRFPGMYRGLDNEFTGLVGNLVGGYMTPNHLRVFDMCIRHMPAGGAVLEIGSLMGQSTNILVYAMQRYNRQESFFTCDPWEFAGTDKPKADYLWTGSDEYREWVRSSFIRNTRLLSRDREPHTVEGYSDEFFAMWREGKTVTDVFDRQVTLGGPLSFVYIDGSHEYEPAASDFANSDEFLLPGGYVFFDDSSDNCPYEGVKRVVKQVSRNDNYELILKHPDYCFRKKS